MNVKRLSSIVLAMSIALMSVGCNGYENQLADGTNEYKGSANLKQPSSQSLYAITFTEFFIEKAEAGFFNSLNRWILEDNSEYLFYVYDPANKTYVQKCKGIKDCAIRDTIRIPSTTLGDTVPLNVKVSEFAATDSVYLMVLEKDIDWNKLNQTPGVYTIESATCKHKGGYPKSCLKIPVQYLRRNLLKNQDYCLTMATALENPSDEICLYYNIQKIEPQQKIHSDFERNLNALSALSSLFDDENLVKFFEKNADYNKENKVDFVDFSDYVQNSVSSVTFYGNDQQFSGLPTKIAQPVVNYLATKYPSGLWVINGADGVLAAYGADQLDQTGYYSPVSISVNWPQGVSKESINNWLKTPEKNQVYRPYHTIRLSYKKGEDIITQLVTGLNDSINTVSSSLTLPGRYTLGKHLDIGKVELSGILSLLQSRMSGTSTIAIELTHKDRNINAQLDLPSGYEYQYKKNCQQISKTLSEWFTTDKVMLQCPRLPKSRIEPDFVNGKVRLNARNKELFLGLRFKNREEQTSLKGWGIGNISLTQTGIEGRMLINARDLPKPKDGKLTLKPPKEAFSIFYLNESISVELSKEQQDYLYTANSVPKFDGSAVINLDVHNPKERPVETFKDTNNPWTPETLTFLCDGTQSDSSLCGKTCRLGPTTAQNSAGLICQRKKIDMPLKRLEGYLMTTRFLGERWGTNSVRLKDDQSLKDFFCGAWQRLFPLDNQVIVVGSDKSSVQMAYLTNPFNKGQRVSQELPLSAFTANQQPVWSYSIKPGEKGKESLMDSVIWQLDSVSGRYDYYLHQNYARKSNGEPLELPTRSEDICPQSPSQSSGSPVTRKVSFGKTTAQIDTAQIDIVAVFAEKYNFQQQAIPPNFSLGLNIPKTSQQTLRAGWMKNWDKHTAQESLRDAMTGQVSKQQRDPSVKLHYHYDDKNDKDDKNNKENNWLWNPMPGQAHLENAPSIKTRRNIVELLNISNVVLNNEIRPHNRRRDDQVTKIINHVKDQWQPNGDYLLVILSDGISEQEMAQLNHITLPRGNGKRQLLILTSDFLPKDSSKSLLLLPKLPSDTGHRVISMYDEKWVKQFVKAIFEF